MSTPEKTKPKYQYVRPERNAAGRLTAVVTLKRGLKIGNDVHKECVLQESNTGDLMDAERDATTDLAINFNMAVIARQLVRIGSYEGPITVGMLRSLSSGDGNKLRAAQAELDIAGEVEP